jgi:GDP-D-mannose 3',5'-epimerase
VKKIVVLGGVEFIGGRLISRLKSMGFWVKGVDIKHHEFKKSDADEFIIADLCEYQSVAFVIDKTIDEVYQLAAFAP